MTAKLKESYRIRCVSGDQSEMWLWTIGVSQGSLPVEVTAGTDIFQHTDQFAFRPQFVPEVVAALVMTRQLAEDYVRILSLQGFDCEVVSL